MKPIVQTNRRSNQPRPRAFTLVELLLVLAILALLAGIVVPRLVNHMAEARVRAAITQLSTFKTAIELFELDTGRLPQGRNGLVELLEKPRDVQYWKGPYLDPELIPKDPWGNDYMYLCPGHHRPNSYDLSSAGPDRQPNTADDISNWIDNNKQAQR